MIMRFWHGVTANGKADAYKNFLMKTTIRSFMRAKGNLGAWVVKRTEAESTHFLLVSLWDSNEAIQRFTGKDIEIAHYYPGEENYLIEQERCVQHYEVAIASDTEVIFMMDSM